MSGRKRALWLCGCFRNVWGLLRSVDRCVVDALEGLADGRTGYELPSALREANEAGLSHGAAVWPENLLGILERSSSYPQPFVDLVASSRGLRAREEGPGDTRTPLLRCLVGNPFRPVPLDPAWLAWQGGVIPRMAEQLYEERRFGDLPVLADALEEAGCDQPDVLGHLRGGGPHACGCWVLDLLRTKLTCHLQLLTDSGPDFAGNPAVNVAVRNLSGQVIEIRYAREALEEVRLIHLLPDGELIPVWRTEPGGPTQPRHTLTLLPGVTHAQKANLWAGLGGPPTGPGCSTIWAIFPHDGLDVVSAPITLALRA
jgi:hypothetical protein